MRCSRETTFGKGPFTITAGALDGYASNLHGDGFPESPNPFLKVAEMGVANETAMQFLVDAVVESWGLARWEPLEALLAIGPEADPFLFDAIRRGGVLRDPEAVAIIRKSRGPEFLAHCSFTLDSSTQHP